MKFSHTLKTTASPDRIWEIWTDVAHWSSWDTELKAACLNGSFSLGAVGELTPKRGQVSAFRISQFKAGESYTFTLKLPFCRLNVHRYLADHSDGLYFTHEISFQGFLAFVFGLLLGRRFKSVLPNIMENIRQLAETAS